jgi:NAD dependent epimerase/dehydratase family enzyme
MAGGRQMVSWIHGDDLVRAVQLALQHPTLQGPVNFAAPRPLPVRDFMRILRTALGVRVGLPLSARMVEMGAAIVGTDPELVLKSRYVVPGRLLASGFTFRFPTWEEAAPDLVSRLR